jgi:hypothetical protein
LRRVYNNIPVPGVLKPETDLYLFRVGSSRQSSLSKALLTIPFIDTGSCWTFRASPDFRDVTRPFQAGIVPIINDAQNDGGGKWTIQLPQRKAKGKVDQMWLFTVSLT